MVKSTCEYLYFLFDWQKQLYSSDLIHFFCFENNPHNAKFDQVLWLYKDCNKLLFFTQATCCSSFSSPLKFSLLLAKVLLWIKLWLELLHLLKGWKPRLLGVVESLKGGSLENQNWLTNTLYELSYGWNSAPNCHSFSPLNYVFPLALWKWTFTLLNTC